MTKENQDVVVYKGTDKEITATVRDDADPPVAVDITGWKLEAIVRVRGSTPLITKKNLAQGGDATEIEDTTPTSGVATIKIKDVDTDPLTVDSLRGYTDYSWALRREDADAEDVLAVGVFRLKTV